MSADRLSEILQASDLFEVVEKTVDEEIANVLEFPAEFFDFFEIEGAA